MKHHAALIENGTPRLGVVHAPALNVTYYAAQSEGAYVPPASQKPFALSVGGCISGVEGCH